MDHYKTPNEKVADTITLTKVSVYGVEASTDEFRSEIVAHYNSIGVAELKTKGVGWWGADGKVRSMILHTDGKQLYEVRPLGNFSDVEKKEREEMIANLKSKLSPAELEFIAKHEGKI